MTSSARRGVPLSLTSTRNRLTGSMMHRSALVTGSGWSFDFGGSYAPDGETPDPSDPPQFYPRRDGVEGYTVEMVAAMAALAAQVTL